MRNVMRPMACVLVLFSLLMTGCGNKKDDPLPRDCNIAGVMISIAEVQPASGCGREDGSFTVSAQSGAGSEFLYSVNAMDFQASGHFTGLAPGYYTVTVRNENQCHDTTSVSIGIQESTLMIEDIASREAGCKANDGEITVNAVGEGTLMFGLNDGPFQTSNVFTDLPAGNYRIVVKDESNCELSAEKRILSGTSYQSQVSDIIQTNCTVSGCHNGDNGASRNWTVFSNVQEHARDIKSFTQIGYMPPAGSGQSLTQEEKDLIACWVDDGALDN